MRIPLLAALASALAIAGVLLLRDGDPEIASADARASSLQAGAASPDVLDVRAGAAPGADLADPARPDIVRAGPPEGVDDPEEIARWFESRVVERLVAPALPPGAQRRFADRPVDWTYVADVLSGRVSGIPSETLAGLTLPEMDELGDIPYVEQLRQEKRFDELRELGFENETIPWPVCIRTGTCGLDARSSPPRT